MTTVPAYFGFPHKAIPPLEVTVRRRWTIRGERFTVAAMDDRGTFRSLLLDDCGNGIRFISAECARRAFWRNAMKWTTQMTVIYRSDWED